MSPTDESSKIPEGMLFARLEAVRKQRQEVSNESVEKARRDLLLASTVTVVISVTGAVPTKVEALGIELSRLEQRWVFAFLGLIAIYFLFKFHLENFNIRRTKFLLWAEFRALRRLLPQLDIVDEREFRNMINDERLNRALSIFFEQRLPYVVGSVAIAAAAYAAFSGHSVLQPVT
jgi:hypothetical protein